MCELNQDSVSSGFSETEDRITASDDYASRFAGPVGEYFLAVQTSITLDLLQGMDGATVLDVGGGHAQLAVPLVRKGFQVTVTGSDDTCRERLDRLLESGSFTYQTCDCLNLPFADRSFTVVLAFRLLPHVTAWKRLLEEMCRVAEQTVILDYPDIRSFNILYRLLFGLKRSLEGNTRTYSLFSRSQVGSVLRNQGFSRLVYRPEFFWPMVLHRKIGNPRIAGMLEAVVRLPGLTSLFGSPIIVRAMRSPDGQRIRDA